MVMFINKEHSNKAGMENIDYREVVSFWDDEYKSPDFHYGQGWHSSNEDFSKIRFNWEIKFYKKIFNLHNRNKDSLMDIGCGNGKHAFFFANYFKEVIGIDLSPKGIRIANNHVKKTSKKNMKFYCKDVATMNLNKKFDVIFDGAVIPYLNEKDLMPFFKNMRKHLKEGGTILFRAPLFSKNQTLVRKGDYHIIYWPVKKITKMLRQAGLQVKGVQINHGYQYGILLDFYDKILTKIFKNRKIVNKLKFSFFGKKFIMVPSNFFLGPFVRVRGHFIIATRGNNAGN
jgi:2-polyprenyl-3-methyl-5-hydroxy-6-metoxy-1,4-benzoquinol methylase